MTERMQHFVMFCRYVSANYGHQASKFDDDESRNKYGLVWVCLYHNHPAALGCLVTCVHL